MARLFPAHVGPCGVAFPPEETGWHSAGSDHEIVSLEYGYVQTVAILLGVGDLGCADEGEQRRS